MRPIFMLLLAVAFATAGCFGGNGETSNEPPADDSADPTAPGAGDGAADAGQGNETPEDDPMGGETEEEDAPKPPQQVITGSADFTNPAAPPAALSGEVPEGYTMANLTVVFKPGTGAVAVSSGVTVTLTGAGGATLVCEMITVPMTEPETCVKEGPIAPGEATVSFEGEGPVQADITVTVTG